MRSAIALLATGWFALAAFVNGSPVDAGDSSVVVNAVRALGQTVFVGLAILSLAMVDWDEARHFFLTPAVPAAPDERPSED